MANVLYLQTILSCFPYVYYLACTNYTRVRKNVIENTVFRCIDSNKPQQLK